MRKWLGAVVGTVIAASVGIDGSGVAFAKSVDPTPVVEGGAFVRKADTDDFAPANEGTPVTAGNAVRSSPTRAARLDVAEGVSIRLAPGTSLVVRSMQWLPAEHPGASPVRALQVSLTSGEIDVDVRDPKGAVGVTVLLPAGRSVALWRGSANVSLDGERAAVALYDGMAIAGAGAKWQPLTAGKGVILAPKSDPMTRPIPGKPEPVKDASAAASFVLVRGGDGGVVGASWSEAQGANAYRFELAHDAAFTSDVTLIRGPTPAYRSDPLVAGSYALRVRAISADGIVGPASAPATLRVARITLPNGAFAAPDGNVVLPASGSLLLDDPRDIEVATVVRHDMPDDTLFWTPASTQIPLGSGARREIRVRHALSHTETSFVLVRRTLNAKVWFMPKHARWPANPIDIFVKVADESGYVDPAREAIDIDTRVDIDRVPLKWQHNGDTWTARLAPQTSAGPWVIRVDVKDSAGTPIGASLLDVDGPGGDPTLRQAAYRP
jgi:hypothetical protein